MREEDVKNERKREQVSWRRTGRESDAKVCHTLYHIAAGGSALQHRRLDIYSKCQLSGFLWQCCKHGSISADGHCTCHSGKDRRRMLCLRILKSWKAGEQKGEEKCRQFHCVDDRKQSDPDGIVSHIQ